VKCLHGGVVERGERQTSAAERRKMFERFPPDLSNIVRVLGVRQFPTILDEICPLAGEGCKPVLITYQFQCPLGSDRLCHAECFPIRGPVSREIEVQIFKLPPAARVKVQIDGLRFTVPQKARSDLDRQSEATNVQQSLHKMSSLKQERAENVADMLLKLSFYLRVFLLVYGKGLLPLNYSRSTLALEPTTVD